MSTGAAVAMTLGLILWAIFIIIIGGEE